MKPKANVDVLTIGFGTTVATWAIGYFLRIPPALAPGWLLLIIILVVQYLGGYFAGKLTGRGWKGGMWSGIISSVLNLLILGSVMSGDQPNEVIPTAALWVPVSILVGALIGSIAAYAGVNTRDKELTPNWIGLFSIVVTFITLILLISGGVVTSKEAGLAVVDWPNSYQYNMFLYPLSKMTGGIYFEHSHRLLGTLVFLSVLVFTLLLRTSELDSRIKNFAWLAVLLVIIQGLLGGLRVTGFLTTSDDPNVTAPNITYAIIHGVLGQAIFAIMVSLAIFTSSVWRKSHDPIKAVSGGTDCGLSIALTAIVIIQILTGAVLRHTSGFLHIHLTFAFIVIVVALFSGIRARGIYKDNRILSKLGKSLLHTVGVQIILGILALIAVNANREAVDKPFVEVLLATTHQATGAVILSISVAMVLWTHRLLPSPKKQEPG
ncbi:MAG TPA: COX15/CtaA family protein [bacterium]|jgi:cytochrome c oxidase assembly protein subunit 15